MLKIDKDCYSREHQMQEVFRMNVSLTPELEEFVGNKVGSGRYNSASEVVREALRLLERRSGAQRADRCLQQRAGPPAGVT